ncbi:rhomboid family intramembrane serine protease [Pendulispora albinea]|uniref:Rhomboid family intramembrane serine protease n=1 Tax=Pendulispora albinea TaxID=2741071 RepID=A0ABZ2M628_9BACT
MSNAQEDNADLAAPAEATRAYSGAPFTLFLTVVIALVFLGEMGVTWSNLGFAWAELANVLFAIPEDVAMQFGANYATATLYEGRIDTLLSSCFVHFGALHILFNLFALRVVGSALEREVGTGRTSVLYLGAGVVSNMVSAIWYGWHLEGQNVGAGASGVVCGLIGATLVVGFRTEGGWRSPLTLVMALWLTVTLALGKQGGFDNAAHMGGAVAGGLIALLWRRGAESPMHRNVSTAAALACVALAGVLVLYYDLTRPFATMPVPQRQKYAMRAVLFGNCQEAWGAARAARRLAPRAEDVLQTVQRVRALCGSDPHTPPPPDSGGASR